MDRPPEVRMEKFSLSLVMPRLGLVASWPSRFAPASNQVIRPTLFCCLKWRCSIGRRRSQSISSVFLPWRANPPARLLETRVLPSPGAVLVTRMALGKSSLDWIFTAL